MYKVRNLKIVLDLIMAVLLCHLHVSLFEHGACRSLDMPAARSAVMCDDLQL